MLRNYLIIINILALSACGFQLRGDASLPFATLFISGGDGSSLQTDLKRAVTNSSTTTIVTKDSEADAQLQLVGEQRERIILALNSAGRVRELQLRYRVNYKVIDGAKKELIPPSELVLNRILSYSDVQVLAKEQEEALLYRDMQQDAAQQILRRLALVKR